MHSRFLLTSASAALAALASVPAARAAGDDPPCAAVGSPTAPLAPTAPDGTRISYCWGRASWHEPDDDGHPKLHQSFYFYPSAVASPLGAHAPHPLVMYFHPDGSRSLIDRVASASLYDQVVQQANDAGWSVVSVEFRHPVADEEVANDPPFDHRVPHWDVAAATQFLRSIAVALDADVDNVFSVGFSRGSLSLWTALQPDMASPRRPQSTRVNAVFGYQAQATYRGDEFATLFVIPADQAGMIAAFDAQYPKHAQFGSALDSVAVDSPPVMLRYEDPFERYPVPAKYFTGRHGLPPAYSEVHFPGYGQELCKRYADAAPATACTVQASVPFESAFDGYVDFFAGYLRR